MKLLVDRLSESRLWFRFNAAGSRHALMMASAQFADYPNQAMPCSWLDPSAMEEVRAIFRHQPFHSAACSFPERKTLKFRYIFKRILIKFS
ncbi:hypothetical protein [Nitrospirillum amazonense]|uniref:hypothetical protein n=1 Tax=Nitrospirillum amazonense TaxID=28077 RepID=UPI0011A5855A|nr:hypothetical protein [Nitrospirillum amazonense]